MKIKVTKASQEAYWYANKIGQVFDVLEVGDVNGFKWKLKGDTDRERYFNKDDVEIINGNTQVFDINKDKWFIHTPTPETSEAVQNWLFDQGFAWQHYKDTSVHHTDSLYLKLSPFEDDAFCHASSIDPKYDKSKEIKLTFKTVVSSVEYPEVKSEQKKQLDIVMAQIKELQKQAESLQGMINK